jgi:hypothetical protein
VAVLQDDKASASMLVTFDPKRNTLTLKRVGDYQEGPTSRWSCGPCRRAARRDRWACWATSR